jgi:hypothetical protein
MDGDDRVLAIVLAAEHLLRLAGVHLRAQFVERAAEVFGDRFAGLGPFDEDGEVVDPAAQLLAQLTVLFQAAAPLQDLLRRRLVFPEIRRGDAFLYLGDFSGGMCGVKDSSADRRRGAPGPGVCEAGRRVVGPWLWSAVSFQLSALSSGSLLKSDSCLTADV